jgi:hypothetical protein
MADNSAQGEDETGSINLGDIPEDIKVFSLQGQIPLYALPEFLWAASAERNRPPAQSVAGSSITSRGSAAVFGRSTRCTLNQIIQDKVIVRKGDRGVPCSKIFVSNGTAATQALPVKFLRSFHLLSKNAAGENNQKAKHIQDQFVSNLDVVKKLVERLNQYNLKKPFQIP